MVAEDQTSVKPASARTGVRETARAFLDLVEPGERGAWGLALALALFAAIVEMLGTGLVFAIAGMFAGDLDPSTLPLVGPTIEQLAGEESGRQLLIVAAAAALFYAFRGGVVLGGIYYQSRVTNETGRRIADRLFRGYLSLPYPFFLRRNTAELIRTAFYSARLVMVNFLSPLLKLSSDSLVSAGMLIVLVLVAPGATALAVVVLVPTVYLLLRLVRPKIQRLGIRTEAENATSLKTLQQSLQGIREIKVTQTDDFFAAVFDRSRSRLARIQYRFVLLSEGPRIVVETLVFLFIIILLVATSIGPLAGGESLAILGLFAYVAFRMMPIVNRTAANINKIRLGGAAVDTVCGDLELFEPGSNGSSPRSRASAFSLESTIEFRDVHFTYENAESPALRNVNLVIKQGETLGIVGHTGSGKSTMLDLILGLLSPTSGEILVDGEPIETRLPSWLSSIGMVPQSVFLIDDTIRRNVAFGVSDRAIDSGRVAEAVKLAQLSAFLDTLPQGAETIVGERGVRLSGGQRQRVAIARALYHDPSILILDEGTSALDNTTETELMEALENASRGRTVIIVAHRLSTVRQADRIVFLDGGRIVDIGLFDELIAHNTSFRELAK